MKLRNLLFGVLAALSVGAFAADPPPPSATFVITTQNLVPGGACTAGGCAELTTQGQGTITVQTVGTYTGALSGQVTTDGTTWITLGASTTFTRGTTGATSATIGSGVQDTFQVTVAGYKRFRIAALGAVTGSVTVSLQGAPGGGGGGGSGGGGGGAVTVADGADSAEGSTTDAAATAGGTGTLSAKQRLMTTQLDQLHTDITASNTQLPAALGQTTAAGSLSVVAASDATNIVAQGSTTSGQKGGLIQGAVTTSAPSYTNGQTAPISLDTAGNVRMSGSFSAADMASFTGTCSASCNSTTLVSWDTTGYQSAEVQFTAVGGSPTFVFQCSSDNTTWYTCNGMLPSATGTSGVAQSSITAVGLYCLPVYSRYQRVFISSWSSGTETVVGYQRSKANCGGIAMNINSQATIATTSTGAQAQGASAGNGVMTAIEARTTAPTATSSGQSTRITGTVYGNPVVLPYSIPELTWQYAAATSGIANTTTAVTMQAATAGVRNYVTGCTIQTATLGGATEFVIQDSTPTVLWRTQLQTTALPLTHIPFPVPLRPGVNTNLQAAAVTAVTGGIYISCEGFQAP